MKRSHKHRLHERPSKPEDPKPIRWPQMLRSIVLGGAVALIVIGGMIPSESAISDGTYAPLAAAWCLLAVVWAASLLLDGRPILLLGWTEAIGTALVGWHSLAAVVSLGQTNGRQALNAHWLVLGYGLTAFLLRQSLRTAQQARSLVAIMIWLATLFALLGLYQYGYSMPKLRRDYQNDPESVLAANGIPNEAGSPQRELFENRLRSVEPLATFALTNSLAGFLAPWLLAMLLIGLASFREPGQWPAALYVAASAIVVAACLVLTKSRTAYLAVVAGLVLIGLYGGRRARLDWRIPAGLAGAVVLIGLIAVLFGGLDVQVLSEAPKSVLYRLEYWQATARMIGDYPLFGCGPGNFQEVYAAYKLPQASEMIRDPHNFLLEMWATAGTPAVLLLIALLVAFTVDLTVLMHAGVPPEPEEPVVAPAKWIVFGGAATGLFVGPPIAAALGFPLEGFSPALSLFPVVWLMGLPLLAASWWLLDAWIARGELTLATAVIPQIALLVNLLAAGALVFPTVMATLLVLTPVTLFVAAQAQLRLANHSSPVQAGASLLATPLQPSKLAAGVIMLAAAGLALACLQTEYYPVLNGRRALANALFELDRRLYREAEPKAVVAAKADSLAPEPWRLLAELRLARWQATQQPKDWQSFVEIADTFRRLDPRHHLAWYTRGNWFLGAWKKSKRPENLEEATRAYREAARLYPNRALYHAQLGWTLHLAGQSDEAVKEADRAVALDEKMPHKEQKLARQHVGDPDVTKGQERTFREESAEQTMQRLRTGSAEEMP